MPYIKGLSYDGSICSIICHALFLHMDMEVMDSLDDMKSIDLYDIWIYLWEMYRDPHVPSFPKYLSPWVKAPSSLVEITTSTIISDDASIYIFMDLGDSIQ